MTELGKFHEKTYEDIITLIHNTTYNPENKLNYVTLFECFVSAETIEKLKKDGMKIEISNIDSETYDIGWYLESTNKLTDNPIKNYKIYFK
jgi:hypothetical protein